jgi:histidinol phosphatase-like PHP family hydrolase
MICHFLEQADDVTFESKLRDFLDVERFSSLIHSVNDERSLVDLDAYDQAVQKVLDFISQRQAYLENTTLLSL